MIKSKEKNPFQIKKNVQKGSPGIDDNKIYHPFILTSRKNRFIGQKREREIEIFITHCTKNEVFH